MIASPSYLESQERQSRAFASMTSHQSEDWQQSGHAMHPQHESDTLYNSNGDYGYAQQEMPWQTQIQRSGPIAIKHGLGNGELRGGTDSDDSDLDVEVENRRGITASSYQEKLMDSNKILQAPYLGSLNNSANFLMSLPPMTLSEYPDEEPPRELTSYGSLRDSHRTKRFLDGPSSYREPRSGQIQRLDHRLRFHSVQDSSNSIADRMQASRKLKEIRQKKEKVNGAKDQGAKSSLSAMMNEASKEGPQQPPTTVGSGLSQQMDAGISSFGAQQAYESSTMMSTSLTAFEVLKSSFSPSESGGPNHHGQSQSSLLSGTMASGDDRFQPLSRSLSDPTPQHQYSVSFRTSQQNPSLLQQYSQQQSSILVQSPPSLLGESMRSDPDPSPFAGSQEENPDMDVAFDMDV